MGFQKDKKKQSTSIRMAIGYIFFFNSITASKNSEEIFKKRFKNVFSPTSFTVDVKKYIKNGIYPQRIINGLL